MSYDTETLVGKVSDFLLANFATKLSDIATEKGDGLDVVVPDSAAYFIQTLSAKMVNFDPYIYVGVVKPFTSDSVDYDSTQIVPIEIALGINDNGEDFLLWKKLFRYQRAMKEIFEKNWNKNNIGPRVTVEQYFLPLPPEYKMQQVGIQLKASII